MVKPRGAGNRRQRNGQLANRTESQPAKGDGLLSLSERETKLGPDCRQILLPGMPGATGTRPGGAVDRAYGEKALRRLWPARKRLFPDFPVTIEHSSGDGSLSGAFARSPGPAPWALRLPSASTPFALAGFRVRVNLLAA